MRKIYNVIQKIILSSALLTSLSTFANETPVGLWKTIDEDTEQAKSYVLIVENNGVLTGTVKKILDPEKQNEQCVECGGKLKDQPILGMTIITGVTAQEPNVWGDGEILDPKNGKTYTLQLTVQDAGETLEVRGYIGFFFRNQYWQRVE